MLPHAHSVNIFRGDGKALDRTINERFANIAVFAVNWSTLKIHRGLI